MSSTAPLKIINSKMPLHSVMTVFRRITSGMKICAKLQNSNSFRFVSCQKMYTTNYSTSIETPKITSREYEKLYSEELLRKLSLRTQTSDSLSDFIGKEVELIGWIEYYPGNVAFVDGYGKISCSFNENQEIEYAIKKIQSNELVCIKGLVYFVADKKELMINLKSVLSMKDNSGEYFNQRNSYTDRTHTCGEIRVSNIGEKVTLCGWLQYQRMSKFLLLRDSYGMTQCIVPENTNMENIPLESVLKVTGTVSARPHDMVNNDMATGEVEVLVENLEVQNRVEDIPFTLRKHQKPKEQLRLQYRYIDLRYTEMQNNIRLRSLMLHNMRKFLIERNSFIEVETPTLFCRTPGGAREFIVPTHHPGLFYSLVQSPQQFKQMLMVGGVDRYFQIARCYRDEATRPDRQPEFTQLDIEMSFTTVQGILKLIEDLVYATYPLPISKPPFRRITYKEALETYGSDKPDLSYELKLNNITSCLQYINSVGDFASYSLVLPVEMKKFSNKVKESIKTMRKRYPRVQILDYSKLPENTQNMISARLSLEASKTLYIAAGPNNEVCLFLGEIRTLLANEMKLRGLLENSQGICEPIWVVEFPLFTSTENGVLETCHHPFTAPHPEDLHLLDNEPLKVRSLAYDLVMNGNEVGGGSIRIHNSDLQVKLLNMLDIDVNTMEHFMKALRSGCPPHGGIALGIDRMMTLACNAESIRDVIAFPKSHEGRDPLSGAPNFISEEDKEYYHLDIKDSLNNAKNIV